MEQRAGHRLPTHEQVLFHVRSGNPTPAVLTDMSVSGAFVQTDSPLVECLAIRIRWCLTEDAPQPARSVLAWVVRRGADGYGIEWADFAPRAVCARLNRHWLGETIRSLQGLEDPVPQESP